MRTSRDTVFLQALNRKAQTVENNANPSAGVKISRNTVPLTYSNFLERTKITKGGGITDTSIATCHPDFDRGETSVWVAYIQNGTLKVRKSPMSIDINNFRWSDVGFSEPAIACSITFNSKVFKNARDEQEFLTDEYLWLFWVTPEGKAYAYQLNSNMPYVEIAGANVSDISAIRGPSGTSGNWDLGLTVFFIMGGNTMIFYRQYIDGIWYDAEQVTKQLVMPNLTYEHIHAFRTWDYRVGISVLASDGGLYQIMSYTEGIATRNTEHISMEITARGNLQKIKYSDTKLTEHINMSISTKGKIIYGLSAVPIHAENVEDAEGNWGTTIKITMDYPCTEGNFEDFVLTDSNGNSYAATSYSVNETEIIVTFIDFNLAARASSVTVSYNGTAMLSPATTTNPFDFEFVPQNLVAPITPIPEVNEIWNDGNWKVLVEFTQPIISGKDDSHDDIRISFNEYDMIPNGSLIGAEKTPLSIDEYIAVDKDINIDNGLFSNIKSNNGVIKLSEVEE